MEIREAELDLCSRQARRGLARGEKGLLVGDDGVPCSLVGFGYLMA